MKAFPPTRASPSGYNIIADQAKDADLIERARAFVALANEVETTPAKLALAWTASNPNASSVIIGASSIAQLEENLAALEHLERLTPEMKERAEAILV